MKHNYKINKKLLAAIALAFFGLAFSKLAFAASGHEAGPTPPFVDFIISKKIYWINFIVYFSIVAFLCSKAFPKAWHSRRLQYLNDIELGKRKLAESEAKLKEARDFYDSVPDKVSVIRQTLEKQIEIDAASLIEEANQKVTKLSQSGSENFEAENRAMFHEFRRGLVDLAIEKARSKARQSASAEVENRLQAKVLDRVSSLIN